MLRPKIQGRSLITSASWLAQTVAVQGLPLMTDVHYGGRFDDFARGPIQIVGY
jgi:hypothetical protein